MKTLKSSLYVTVHGAEKSVEQLADEIGVSASYLYRACLDGESGCRFPLDLLLPLMQATKDYRVLEHLNARAGKLTVDSPRVGRLKKRDPQTLNQISGNFAAVMAKLIEFFDEPYPGLAETITCDLHKHLCEVVAMKRAVAEYQQGDLF